MEVERERALQRMLRKPAEETANNFGVEPVPQGGDIAPARVWDLADIVELKDVFNSEHVELLPRACGTWQTLWNWFHQVTPAKRVTPSARSWAYPAARQRLILRYVRLGILHYIAIVCEL